MKMLKHVTLLMLALLTFTSNIYAKEDKWYRVEMIVFEMPGASGDAADAGMPAVANAASLSDDPKAEFVLLNDKQLSLNNAKARIQKRYPVLLHKGWRQVINDKEHSQKVHLIGGRNDNEVDGTVRLSMGRNLNVEADLLMKKIGQTPRRLKESSRLRIDEITYIDHPNFGVLVMVTPEKSQSAAKPAVAAEKPAETKAKAVVSEEEDNDKPILPSQRKALIQKGA